MMVLAVPNVGSAFRLDALDATPSPTIVAATATMSSASTRAWRRHSRRNSRHAQRTIGPPGRGAAVARRRRRRRVVR